MKNDIKQPVIVFFGTPDFAVPSLHKLHKDGYDIGAVVTAPDQLVGRKKLLTPSPVKQAALELGLSVTTPQKLDDAFFEEFKKLKPDLCIIVAYGKIIPEKYLAIPHLGFLNIHPSLLPKYRGPSPIQTAILNGETITGTSLQIIDKEIDHGPIIAQSQYEIPSTAYYPEVATELSEQGAQLLSESLPNYIGSEITPQEQDHSQATFCHMLSREDGRIRWNQPGEEVYNQIRALSHEPGTWTTWQGKSLRIIKAEPTMASPSETPGTVIKVENSIAIQTSTSPLIVLRMQLEGGKEVSSQEFVIGHPNFIGSKLE